MIVKFAKVKAAHSLDKLKTLERQFHSFRRYINPQHYKRALTAFATIRKAIQSGENVDEELKVLESNLETLRQKKKGE